jgi:hypothetical protein
VASMPAKMNRDRAYDLARRSIGRELFYFGRYVLGMERGPQMVRELELLARRVGGELS